MAKSNAKVKVDKEKKNIFAIYNPQGKGVVECIIGCQAYRLTDEYSFIVFKKEKVFFLHNQKKGDKGAFVARYKQIYARLKQRLEADNKPSSPVHSPHFEYSAGT